MAIISFTNYKRGQTTGCMSAVMRYTMQDKKTEFEGQQLVTGINCQPESVYADFMTTKRLYRRIQAEQEAKNIGAVIGLVAGVAMVLTQDEQSSTEQQWTEDQQAEQTQQQTM